MDTQQQTSSQEAEVLQNLESLIRTAITDLERKKDEMKKLSEMTVSFLSQDPVYQEHEKLAKDAQKKKKATKAQLTKNPSVSQTVQKVKEIRTELKSSQEGLSEYLREYHRISGSNEIEDSEGQMHEIVYIAKLVKRSPKKP